MFDRRMVTDLGLALLIALPSALPAAPSPWNADQSAGRFESSGLEAPRDARELAQAMATAPVTEQRYGRS